MKFKKIVFALALALPSVALAAHSGHYSNGEGSVEVKESSDGYDIELTGTCGHRRFRGAEAETSNKVVWQDKGCTITVLNSDSSSAVTSSGCDAYCSGEGSWDLLDATKD